MAGIRRLYTAFVVSLLFSLVLGGGLAASDALAAGDDGVELHGTVSLHELQEYAAAALPGLAPQSFFNAVRTTGERADRLTPAVTPRRAGSRHVAGAPACERPSSSLFLDRPALRHCRAGIDSSTLGTPPPQS